tara:strand:+ start:450 stop:1295 length:846 start_codon:yes stop_codon:yes gene_type:complete
MNALELINIGSEKLKNTKIPSYKLDSEIILSKVLKKKREEIITNLDQTVDHQKEKEFKKLIHRRSLNEPIAYIFKEKEFWSKNFKVNKNTLIPRPETELMIEQLLKILKKKSSLRIVDLGTGSGCILISLMLELKTSSGIGIDISNKALKIANLNAFNLKINNKLKFWNRDVSDIFNNKFDLAISNPPYIMRKDIKNLPADIRFHEPKIALDGGNDGLDVIKKVIYKAKNILKFKGILALEIGRGQYKKVSKILKANNFKTEHIVKDYKENIRCLILKLIK